MSQRIIELRDVKKSYGQVYALGGVNLHIDRAEVVGLVGDNGAGKSTLIKILAAAVRPSRGLAGWTGQRRTSHRRSSRPVLGGGRGINPAARPRHGDRAPIQCGRPESGARHGRVASTRKGGLTHEYPNQPRHLGCRSLRGDESFEYAPCPPPSR